MMFRSAHMKKSPELDKQLKEDVEFKLFDSIGNALDAVETYVVLYKRNKEQKYLQKIQDVKEEFYRCLKEIKNSSFTPKGKINPESLEKFDEFKDLDWSKEETIEKIKEYLQSLRSW